jgi:hypothetical protein
MPLNVNSDVHAPFEHACPAGQAAPQPPQLFASFLVSVSQPSACLSALQSAKPVLQSPVHTPLVQARET